MKEVAIQSQIDLIQNKLKESMSKFLDKPNGEDTVIALKATVTDTIKNLLVSENAVQDILNFKFNLAQADDKITMSPENLFSYLLLQGHYVPFFLVKDLKEWHVKGVGTFIFDNGKTLFRPEQPMIRVNIDFPIEPIS